MKRIILLLIAVFVCVNAYGATVNTRVSGGTVSFNTVYSTVAPTFITPTIITFNTTTKHIIMWNESVHYDCYVDLRCVDANGNTGHTRYEWCTVKLPKGGGATPNVVQIDFATRNLGFLPLNEGILTGTTEKVTYIVLSDWGNFD